MLLHAEPLLAHAHLQGHALGRPDRDHVPRPHRPGRASRRWPSSTSASAPTPSRRGRWPTPTATSPTTARSTRCAATSTGCGRARRSAGRSCSATTSQRSSRSPAKACDSATFDNVLEFLVMNGRSLPHAILMMIPEPWQNHESMSAERKAFYEYHASLMEPWDGPASIAFTDGTRHRRRARPQRAPPLALLRHQGRPRHHGLRGRRARHPGRERPREGAPAPRAIFLVDTAQGRIIDDEEIKHALAAEHPYARVAARPRSSTRGEPARAARCPRPTTTPCSPARSPSATRTRTCASCWRPWPSRARSRSARWAPTPRWPCSPNRPRPALRLLQAALRPGHQSAAGQIREELVTSMESTVGPEGNLLEPDARIVPPDRAARPDPRQRGAGQARATSTIRGFKPSRCRCSTRWPRARPGSSGRSTTCSARASQAIADGYNIVILSDRGVTASAPPSRACSPPRPCTTTSCARGERTRCGLVVETGDAREVHHMCLLIGYGAGAVNPWVAFETLDDMIRAGPADRRRPRARP